MIKKLSRDMLRRKRHERIRLRLAGSTERPRLSIFRSAKFIYAQVIDDSSGRTLAAASSREATLAAGSGKVEAARSVGRALAQRAKAAGVSAVVLDRGGYRYHGRVRSLAEGAREGGLDLERRNHGPYRSNQAQPRGEGRPDQPRREGRQGRAAIQLQRGRGRW
jgi:large subunit ribosomal protein L18